jgi:lipid-binding SYLF domain-containing protein
VTQVGFFCVVIEQFTYFLACHRRRIFERHLGYVTEILARKGISMRTIVWVCALAAVGAFWLGGCTTAPKSATGRETLEAKAQTAIQTARSTDPGLQKFFDTAAGYAVFPEVGKGAVGVGGAFGRGLLFENGQVIGYTSLTQASVGLALGGQEYTEIIFFETPQALERFKRGDFSLSAQASAVALRSGASAKAAYVDNIVVFTMGESGLMVEASVGGQKFNFEPIGTTSPVQPAMSTTTR